MASPQKENGYTAIANELVEALTKIRIPGEAMQVFLCIFRKTYGFNKIDDAISLTQFMVNTGLKKNAVCKGLAKLKQMNLITQKGYSVAHIYRVNKDFSTWLPLPKKSTSTPKGESGVPQKVNNHTPKRVLQKTVTKVDITKDTRAQGAEQKLFNIFYKSINPTISFNNKTEWKAAEELITKFGEEKTFRTAEYAISIHGKPYAPNIASPYQLKAKLPDLMAYYKKENSKQTTNKNLIL